MRPIVFKWEGALYEADEEFYNKSAVQLPDGRILVANLFLESLPPQPRGLHLANGGPIPNGYAQARRVGPAR